MAALDALEEMDDEDFPVITPLDPGLDVLNNANPVNDMPVTSQAIANLRSDVAVQAPGDPFNDYLVSMMPSAAQMAQNKAAVIEQQRLQQEARNRYMQFLQAQYSPERERAENWQTLGEAGAAMLASPNNPWGAGATAQMQGYSDTRKNMDNARMMAAQQEMTNAKDDAAMAQAQYNMDVEQQKEGIKGLIDYRKTLAKVKAAASAAGKSYITDITGATYFVDKNNPSAPPQLVLASNGLTPQQMSNLGDMQNKLIEQYGSDPRGMRIVTQIVNKKRDELIAFNKASLPATATEASAQEMPGIRNDTQLPYILEESPSAPKFTDEERRLIAEDYAASRPDGIEATSPYGIFAKEDLTGVQLQPPTGADKLTQDNWADMQKKATTEAFKDEEAARASLAQATAMYESSKAALATGAKTNAIQPFVNMFGSVLGALGLEGGLSQEAIRGKAFDAIKNQAVQVMQNAAKGAQTEGDAQRFKESLVQVKNAAEANQLILKFMEAQVWKRKAEISFRNQFTNMPNQAIGGASSKWTEWDLKTPALQNIKGRPVFVQDFIKHMIEDNPDIVKNYGENYVTQEAIKEWRKLQN